MTSDTDEEIEEKLMREDRCDLYKSFGAAVFYMGLFCTGVYYLTQL